MGFRRRAYVDHPQQPDQQLPLWIYPARIHQGWRLRIESSLDEKLTTPKSYSWSATFERQLPKSSLLQISYLGRAGRHLLAQRDIMQPIDLVDPKSGMDWYTAGTMLGKLLAKHAGIDTSTGSFVDPSQIPTIPYFENLFPNADANLGYNKG